MYILDCSVGCNRKCTSANFTPPPPPRVHHPPPPPEYTIRPPPPYSPARVTKNDEGWGQRNP